MVGEQGVINESVPEEMTFDLWNKGNKGEERESIPGRDTTYAKVLCQEGGQSVKELKWRQCGCNTKSMREKKNEVSLGGKLEPDHAGP